jgi:hypothetical protein
MAGSIDDAILWHREDALRAFAASREQSLSASREAETEK